MTAAEKKELQRIDRLLAEGEVRAALTALDGLRRSGSQAFLQRDGWRLDEKYGTAWYALGDGAAAAAAYWDAASHDRFLSAQLQHYSSYLFCLHYAAGIPDAMMREQHAAYGHMLAAIPTYKHAFRSKVKLRIGYLSPSFHEHTVSRFCQSFFTNYDRTRYEVYGYDTTGRTDAVTAEFRARADGWRSLAGDDYAAAAAKIYEDRVDILVDLGGHTDGGKTLMLMAYRPAPVQISALGWFDTTGLPAVDYLLTDRYCLADGAADQFVEQPLSLPHTQFCYMPPAGLPQPFPLDTAGPRLFASFHNYAKITDAMLVLWRRILHAVPGARLLLKDTTAYPERQTWMAQRVLRAGFAPEEVELQPGSLDYWKEYRRADILLDTYPYTGGGMTCEALYMGVPVVSRYGRRHGTRFGWSILSNLQLGDLASDSDEGYVTAAVSLAKNVPRLDALHRTLRTRMQQSPLMDPTGYIEAWETGYETVWRRWQKQLESTAGE